MPFVFGGSASLSMRLHIGAEAGLPMVSLAVRTNWMHVVTAPQALSDPQDTRPASRNEGHSVFIVRVAGAVTRRSLSRSEVLPHAQRLQSSCDWSLQL